MSNSVEPSTKEVRETWSHKIDFLLACIGFSVGLGNVWRFPFLCHKHGGGAFLVPYFIFVIIGGIPLFYLEVAVGQFMSVGGAKAWNICPLLQGIGWASTVVVFFLNCYYNIVLTWSVYYMFASFTTTLPWDGCGNSWNTENCSTFTNATLNNSGFVDSTAEYWERKVLAISNSIDDIGTIKWDLALCLALAWIVILICIWNGIKTSGKVMYFTATSPYIFMVMLLVRGCLLEGAWEGIKYYMIPDFSKLNNIQVWVDAGTQIFFSYSIGLGALTALGSYNKFKHNSYRDSIVFAMTNSGTSILAGFVIFSILGFMAHTQGISDVGLVVKSGPGLAFIAYPKAVAQMPWAPLWSVLFFIMFILLGLDSQFVGVEGFITSCSDAFPTLRTTRNRHLFLVATCLVKFLIGLLMVTNGGMYVFQLMDYYSGSKMILLIGFMECVAVAWVYGVNRFYDNIEMMLGFRPNGYMKFCWSILSPAFCLVVFVLSVVSYTELTYKLQTGFIYQYPTWSIYLGWSTAGLAALCVPLVLGYNILNLIKNKQPLSDICKPKGLKEHQLGINSTTKDVVLSFGTDFNSGY